MSRGSNAPRKYTGCMVFLILLMLVFIGGTVFMGWLCYNLVNGDPISREEIDLPGVFLPEQDPSEETEETVPETTMPEPEKVVATATIASTGDVLMHMPVIETGRQADGSYNFESIFRYLKPYSESVDFAAANLETTLAGTDNGYKYSGYPAFNCPDGIVTSVADAGFDMLLTANNHSYDTGMVGYQRTLEVVRGAGLETLGTMATAEDPKYLIKEINGIKIGMINYTYAYSVTKDGRPSLNGMPHISEVGLCNFYHSDNLSGFYSEVAGYLDEMKAAGVEATVMFIHWGVEYQTYANNEQKEMAQQLCDMGIDVIIGSHPHVVQPVELLTSTVDANHKTVCLYSMGNAVSNQRQGYISYISTAHTEDGVWFSVTFEKYSDGKVYLADVNLIPTWVNMHTTDHVKQYNILPLDSSTRDQWQSLYSLTDPMLTSAGKSYDRTMAIVGTGLTTSREYLAQQKLDRDAYYLDLAMNPQNYDENGNPLFQQAPETMEPESTEAAE